MCSPSLRHLLARPLRIGPLLLAVGLVAASADAAPGAFTDASAFAAALPGGTATIDFEALPDGSPLSSTTQTAAGAGAGIVLPAPLVDVLDPSGPPLPLRVVANAGDNPASSGSKSLGVEDPGNFHAVVAGSMLGFGFTAPVDAFGLTLVTPEEPGAALFDGDLRLLVPGQATASLVLADGHSLGTFGGREYRAYFLGVVGTAPFTSASLDLGPATPPGTFLFNVDDLLVPVPEPGTSASLLAGAAWLAALRRLDRTRRTTPCR